MRRPSPAAASLLAVTFLGLVLRGFPALVHDWPARDGGLFWQMTADVLAASFALPDVTTYNGGTIPFAYPPLSFYVVAILESVTPLDRAAWFRALPVLFSTLAIPGVAAVARELLPTTRHAIAAAAAYAVIPVAYQVHVTGGGLPRSLGFLIALGAVLAALVALRTRRARPALVSGVLGGLAVATHPQSAVFVVVALGVFLLARFSRRGSALLVLAALVAAACAAPWWLTTILRHGPDPLVAALMVSRRDIVESAVAYLFFMLASTPAIAVLDFLGQARTLADRRPALPGWRAAIYVLDLRYAPVAGAVPTSLLAAIGLVDGGGGVRRVLERRLRAAAQPVLAVLTVALVVAALAPPVVLTASLAGRAGALSAADREAMSSLRSTTVPGVHFVVLSGHAWGSDDIAEWFPALSGRVSVNTGQGLEWTGGTSAQLAAEEELRSCRRDDPRCVEDWLARRAPGTPIGFYVTGAHSSSGECCTALADSLRASPRYEVLRDDAAALVAIPRSEAERALREALVDGPAPLARPRYPLTGFQ